MSWSKPITTWYEEKNKPRQRQCNSFCVCDLELRPLRNEIEWPQAILFITNLQYEKFVFQGYPENKIPQRHCTSCLIFHLANIYSNFFQFSQMSNSDIKLFCFYFGHLTHANTVYRRAKHCINILCCCSAPRDIDRCDQITFWQFNKGHP